MIVSTIALEHYDSHYPPQDVVASLALFLPPSSHNLYLTTLA